MVDMRSLGRELRTAPWRLSLLHGAPHHRILWLTQGQGRVLINAQRRGVGTNTFLFVPAGQSFALEAGYQMTGHLLILDRYGAGVWPASAHLIRTREVRHQGEIMALFDALAREQEAQRGLRDEAMAALACLVSVWLRRRLAADGDPPDESTASDRLIAAFLSDLERLHPTGAHMADYADRLDVTPTHLSRVCKAALGRTAAELIAERTLHAARELLATTRKPAKVIAEELGFGSPAYFSRFILAQTGQTPKALRSGKAGPGTPARPPAQAARRPSNS